MSDSLLSSKLQGWLYPLLASTQFRIIRRGFNRGSEALLVIRPLWVLVAALLVFFSYLLQWGSFLPWIGLAMAFLPFPLHRMRHGHLKLSTPLDLPIALFLISALVGLIVSPKLGLSLGAFQCILAASLFYYSWVNYPQLATLMKWLIPIGILSVIAWVIFASVQWIQSTDSLSSFASTYHGMALSLIILAVIFAGVAIFSRGTPVKLVGGLVCLAIFIGVILLVEDSLSSLLAGESISGRSHIWGNTIDMIGDSPFTGPGLGCWYLTYYNTDIITQSPKHAHNAYLELYSNTGFLGALALVIALIIGFKLAWNIIKSSRTHPWYGFGIGVLLACFITLVVGTVESAPMGVPLVGENTYYYIISPAPWVLAGLLVSAHRLISKAD